MALLYIDGFDHYTTYTQKGWSFSTAGANGSATLTSASARGGVGQGVAIQSGNSAGSVGTSLYHSLPANRSTVVLGFAWNNQGIGTSAFSRTLCTLYDGNTNQIDVRCNESLALYVTRNSTTLTSPSGQTCPTGQWRYIEVKATIHPTAGSVEVRIEGVTVATFSGNTSASGNPYITRFSLGGVTIAINVFDYFDDLYLLEADSAIGQIDFLGNVRVQTLLPNAAGTNVNFGRTGAAATNWQSVNETPPDTTTSVFGNTAGQYDTYQYPDLTTTTNRVIAVAQSHVWQKDDSGFRSATMRVRSAGSEADLPNPVLPIFGTYSVQQQIQETSPFTSTAWTPTEVNGAEFGPKVAA